MMSLQTFGVDITDDIYSTDISSPVGLELVSCDVDSVVDVNVFVISSICFILVGVK